MSHRVTVLLGGALNAAFQGMYLTIQQCIGFSYASLVSAPLSDLVALKLQLMKREKYHLAWNRHAAFHRQLAA